MSSPDVEVQACIARQTRLSLLEAAVLAQFRGALDDQYDGMAVYVSLAGGETEITIEYLRKGVSLSGESL